MDSEFCFIFFCFCHHLRCNFLVYLSLFYERINYPVHFNYKVMIRIWQKSCDRLKVAASLEVMTICNGAPDLLALANG